MNREAWDPGCPGIELLKSYSDGEAAAEESLVVKRHLAGCPACREEVRIMERIGEEVKGLGSLEAPPAGLRERVLDRVAPPRRTSIWELLGGRRWLFEGAAAVVAVALVAAILFPVFSTAREATRRGPRPASSPAAGLDKGMPPASPAAGGPAPMGKSPTSDIIERARRTGIQPSMQKSYSGGAVSPDDINRYVRGREGELTKRRVVQTAELTVRLKVTLEEAEKDLTTYLGEVGGYVENSALSSREDQQRVASLTVRVPVERFEKSLEWLAALGDVTAKNVRGEDVTGTWIDQRAEVRELRAEEARLLRRFNQARSPVDRDQARWELIQLRTRVRASEERMAATAKLADLATLRVTLVQPRRVSGAGLMGEMGETFAAAVGTMMVAVRIPLFILVWVLVFTPLWLPAVLVYRWVQRVRAGSRGFL